MLTQVCAHPRTEIYNVNLNTSKFGIRVPGRGFDSRDAVIKLPWIDEQHPLPDTPMLMPSTDNARVYDCIFVFIQYI